MFNKLIILFWCFSLMFTSCDKTYKYVEEVSCENDIGTIHIIKKDPIIIKAKDDTTAYIKAFQKFCISVRVNDEMKYSTMKSAETPVSFILLNDDDKNIVNSIKFVSRVKQEDIIKKKIFIDTKPFAIKQDLEKSKAIDSIKIKTLKQYFRIIKDEFSNTNQFWYKPKSSPIYTNANGIYLYFQTNDNIADNLRLKIQYSSDEWLFINKVQFAIDGKAYNYYPTNVERDNGNGGEIWEWSDEQLSSTDYDLIYALANAKSAKMKLIGDQYYKVKSINKDEIISINRTLELFRLMGGKY